jgi:hypothetical protein
MGEKPRLGPYLRQYAEEERKSPRERAQELALGGLAGVGMLAVLVGVLLAFVRAPLLTLGGLIAAWGVGFVILVAKKHRSDARERELRERLDADGSPRSR